MKNRLFLDPLIIGPVTVLLLIAFIIQQSVSPQDFGRRVLFVVLGFTVYSVFSLINLKTASLYYKYIYLLSILLLLLTYVFGAQTRGSIRWINLGYFTLQTSELIKPLMILVFASYLQGKNIKYGKSLMVYLGLVAVPVFLVLKQPDLGSAIILAIIGLTIAFAAGMSLRQFVYLILGCVILTPIFYELLQPYQKERILAFFNPYSDPLGSGYSVIQAMIAVGAGKFFGRGLGHGVQSQLRFIPERHSDFIFASLAEELGFVGSAIIMLCYFVLLFHLLKTSGLVEDSLGKTIILGTFSLIAFQVIVNIGMNLGILPITGITLPLISSGGSSLLAVMMSLGLAQAVVSKKKPIKTIEIH